MTKLTKFISLIVCGFLLGCTSQPEPQPAPPSVSVIVEEKQPEVPDQRPTPPQVVTKSYIKGYRDGFYGTWLAPGRWVVKDEYRAGWSAGSYDRTHNLPNQHP